MSQYFGNVDKIVYEGKESDNPLAFKHYNPNEVVAGKTMAEHLRFSIAYWHSFTAGGADPFGEETMERKWNQYSGMDLAKARVDAAFELMDILDAPYFAFHDRDIAPEGDTLRETNANLDVIVSELERNMKASGRKLLWNTANMGSRIVASFMVRPRATMPMFLHMLRHK